MKSAEWEQASRHPSYTPDAFAEDGFIHCCTAEQLTYVGDRYFRGQQDLVVLFIDETLISSPVKYEDLAAENMLFPHVYGALNTNAVKNVLAFPL